MNSRIGHLKYSCKYPNCTSKYYTRINKQEYYNKRFHRFPRDQNVSRAWKDVCNIRHDVITDNFYLCDDHFNFEDFVNHTKQRLKHGVVPIRPQQDSIISDHDYSVNLDVDITDSEANVVFDDKYSFLLENKESLNNLVFSTANLNFKLSKKAMLDIHQTIESDLVRLECILAHKSHILQKLSCLYKFGKFAHVNKRLESLSHVFLDTQLESVKPLIAKKWSDEENFLALSLYNKNKKLYKYLWAYFGLPPVQMLQFVLFKIPFKTGINEEIINQMKLKLNINKIIGNRACVLMIGEIPLTSNINYEEASQQLCGNEDLDYLGKSARQADRVLVLMARGLRRNWRQVIAYFFASDPFKSINLVNIIVTATKKLQEAGFNVLGLVCEQNPTNLDALSFLCTKIESRTSLYFFVNGKRVSVIFNVPHLLMETRNALTKCKILYDEKMNKYAKLEHIESAYNLDQSKRIYKSLYKLKDHYFDVKPLSHKTNMGAATTVLSHTVASSIESFVLCGDLPEEAMNTAEFASMMDILFDSLNGFEKKPPHYNKYRCRLSARVPHFKFWASLLSEMNNWTLLDLKSGQNVTKEYCFIKGWQATIESVLHIWSHLQHRYFFKSISLRKLNLEPLEKLFAEVSQYATDRKGLTCSQFVAALKSELLCNKYREPVSTESPTDDWHDLDTLKVFTKGIFDEEANISDGITETFFDDLNLDIINNLEVHEAAAYLSGYLLQKMEIPECDSCRSHLLANWVINNKEIVSLREYTDDSKYSLYASDLVIITVDKILHLLDQFLKSEGVEAYLEDIFKASYTHEFESFKFCNIHNANEALISLCIKLGIQRHLYCLNN